MEELINRIIDIEQKAQDVVEEAKKTVHDIEEKAEIDTRRLSREIKLRVETKCESIKTLEDDFAEKQIEEINTKTNEQIEELMGRYNEKKEEWISEIVSNILS